MAVKVLGDHLAAVIPDASAGISDTAAGPKKSVKGDSRRSPQSAAHLITLELLLKSQTGGK
jgi:hypothetical protein